MRRSHWPNNTPACRSRISRPWRAEHLEPAGTGCILRAVVACRRSCRRPHPICPCLASAGCAARHDRVSAVTRSRPRRSAPGPGQDVAGRIHVPIVRVSTRSAHPQPYNELPYSLGAGEGPAVSAHSRRVPFADDLDASAGLLALVLQLHLEHSPARIEHGLCHPCPGELEAAHVADDDRLITLNNRPRELVQGIGATAGRLAMNPLRLPLVPPTLRPGKLLRVPLRPSTRLEPLPVACGGDAL